MTIEQIHTLCEQGNGYVLRRVGEQITFHHTAKVPFPINWILSKIEPKWVRYTKADNCEEWDFTSGVTRTVCWRFNFNRRVERLWDKVFGYNEQILITLD